MRYCSDCTYFNPKDKKDGIDGWCKCSKHKKYMLGNQPKCDKYSEAHARKKWYRNELYNAAKKIPQKSPGSLDGSIFTAIFLMIITFILFLMGKI